MELEIDEDDVSCAVCLEVLSLPTSLPCSHVFCRPCLLSVSSRAGVDLSCPLCRTVFSLPLRPVDEALASRVLQFTRYQADKIRQATSVVAPPLLHRDEWLVILRMLEKTEGPSSVAKVGAVCRGLYRVAQDGYLWRELCIRDFAFVPGDDEGVRPSWRRRYDAAKKRARGWQQGKPSDWKLTTLRGPASHVVQLSPLGGRKISVRYADNSCISWDTKTEQTAPDDTLLRVESPVVAISATMALRTNGNALQLIDTSNNNTVLATVPIANGTTAAASYDSGVAVVPGATICAFNVSTKAPFSVTLKCSFSANSPANAVHISGRRIVSAHQDHCVRVWDLEKPEKCLYALLGGSLRPRPGDVPHPTRPGCSLILVDSSRIVAAFGGVVKCFALAGEEE